MKTTRKAKLDRFEVPLDEREDYGKLFKVKPVYVGKAKATKKEFENRLFPKPKKAKGNFGKTISKQPLTFSKDKRIIGSGVKKQISTKRVSGRKTEMQKTIKAQKYAALAALAAGAIYGITRYSQDMVIVIAGTLLVALLVEKSLKD